MSFLIIKQTISKSVCKVHHYMPCSRHMIEHGLQDCFGSPFFNACIEALQLHEDMEKYNEWRDTLGKK
uniref:Uncharacterized protein n=1 Tax=Glossina pallidipes TaxID=7398 RepID=A0A1B0AF26_GLOPL